MRHLRDDTVLVLDGEVRVHRHEESLPLRTLQACLGLKSILPKTLSVPKLIYYPKFPKQSQIEL